MRERIEAVGAKLLYLPPYSPDLNPIEQAWSKLPEPQRYGLSANAGSASALHDPRLLRVANWLVEYPFANRLYPHVFEVIQRVKRWGQVVILSDGDAVFQPRKICRSGLWHAFGGRVLVFIHKEEMLADVERMYSAHHYVMIDDKLRILEAIKNVWKSRVTTVCAKQGHYAHDPKILSSYSPADIKINRIGDLLASRRSVFVHT